MDPLNRMLMCRTLLVGPPVAFTTRHDPTDTLGKAIIDLPDGGPPVELRIGDRRYNLQQWRISATIPQRHTLIASWSEIRPLPQQRTRTQRLRAWWNS